MLKKSIANIICSAFSQGTHHKKAIINLTKTQFNSFKFNPTNFLVYTQFSTKVVKVPSMGDSITDGVVFKLTKKVGDYVNLDEVVGVIETEKVKVDVASTEAGVLTKLYASEGQTVDVGKPFFEVDTAAAKPAAAAGKEASAGGAAPKETKAAAPAAEKKAETKAEAKKDAPKAAAAGTQLSTRPGAFSRNERREKMSRMRLKIAQRLKEAQNTYALLTTFQEVDMGAVMDLRNQVQTDFQKKHNVKLGFMSFFLKAATLALQEQPIVNAVINGDEVIYREFVDISVAVATPNGLLVPVIRNCESLTFSDYEKVLAELANKGKNGTITAEDMAGGTFTISNGGVFGSLMGTPILNPPQSAILGMHAVINRPVVRGENIVARPMMYLALTYDHRLIDGREAATFLKRIQTLIEDPRRMLLDV